MINLRYHIVSITAVFLALAIGIIMGTTFISRATVDQLKHNINSAENRIARTEHADAVLKQRLRSWINGDSEASDNLVEELVQGRLTGAKVAMLATPDVSSDVLKNVERVLLAAGADLSGTITLDQGLTNLDPTSDTSSRLADVLGVSKHSSIRKSGPRLLSSLARQLGADLYRSSRSQPSGTAPTTTAASRPGAPRIPAAPTTTTLLPSTRTEPKLITDLRRAGFLDFDPAPGKASDDPFISGTDYRLVVLAGTEPPAAPAQPANLNSQLVIPLLEAITRRGPAPLVTGSAADPDLGQNADGNPEAVRSYYVSLVRASKGLDGRLTTIDDLDRSYGLATLVLSLTSTALAHHGHYGIGDGATELAPTPS